MLACVYPATKSLKIQIHISQNMVSLKYVNSTLKKVALQILQEYDFSWKCDPIWETKYDFLENLYPKFIKEYGLYKLRKIHVTRLAHLIS